MAPDSVDRQYRMLNVIGEGRTGVTYLAEQQEPIRRLVAIRIMRVGTDAQDVLRRLESLQRALAMVSHPGVAGMFNVGMTDDGRPYAVMEYIPGLAITRYCDRARLSTLRRIQLFTEVCHIVEHVHHCGVVHGNVNASNVLVTGHSDVPVPKIVDFSIVSAPEQPSPEQAATVAADVRALGALLRELMTGREHSEARELHATLDSIIDKALLTAAGEGYSSAGQLGEDLNRLRNL